MGKAKIIISIHARWSSQSLFYYIIYVRHLTRTVPLMPPLQATPILLWATFLFSIKVSLATHSSSPNSRDSHHHVARARADQVPIQVDLHSRGFESAEGNSPVTST